MENILNKNRSNMLNFSKSQFCNEDEIRAKGLKVFSI